MNDTVIIELDRPRRMWLGYEGLKTIVARTGKTIEELDEGHITLSNFEVVEAIFHAALLDDAKQHNETLTTEKVSELMNSVPYGTVFKKVIETWIAQFPTPEGNPGKPAEKSAKGEASGEKG